MDRAARAAILRALTLAGAAAGLGLVAAVLGRGPNPRLVRAGHAVASPSGRFTAQVETSEGDGGDRLWRPVVLDERGAEVYRSEGVFAAVKGLAITWEPGLDTLWVVSPDAGTLFVQEGPHAWTATALTRATADLVPAEVRGLSGS